MLRRCLPNTKSVMVAIGLIGLLSLGGCSTSSSESAAKGQTGSESDDLGEIDEELAAMLPDDVQDAGAIAWGVEPYYPPFTQSKDDDDTVVGINVDLAEEMSALLGVNAEVLPGSFDGLIPGIQSERYDVAIATVADTEERREAVDFIDYFQSGSAIFVQPDNPLGIEGMDDLCGRTVGVVKGTFQVNDAEAQAESCEAEGAKAVDVQVFNQQAGMLLALGSGRSEAILIDYVAGNYAAATEGGDQFEMTGDIETPQRKGMLVSKDRTELRDAVQAAMQELMDNGTYLDILEEWDQKEGALEEVTINDGN